MINIWNYTFSSLHLKDTKYWLLPKESFIVGWNTLIEAWMIKKLIDTEKWRNECVCQNRLNVYRMCLSCRTIGCADIFVISRFWNSVVILWKGWSWVSRRDSLTLAPIKNLVPIMYFEIKVRLLRNIGTTWFDGLLLNIKCCSFEFYMLLLS